MRPLKVFSYGGGPASAIVDHFPAGAVQQAGLVSRQSLISAMGGPSRMALADSAARPAAVRVLQADIASSLRNDVEARLPGIDLVLWDLFDERFGVDRLSDGTYLTRSPERIKHVSAGSGAMRTIPFGTDEHFGLWREAAERFTGFLARKALLLRTYVLDLAWAHTDENGLDAELPFGLSSDEANARFSRYASYLRDRGVQVLTHSRTWTSRTHQWGPAPYNLHDAVYREVAEELLSRLPGELTEPPAVPAAVVPAQAFPAHDERHKAPILVWAGLDDFDASREGRTHHRVAPAAGQSYGLCSLIQNNGSDTLLVISHGALNREKYSLPRFEWLATLEGRPENLMFLADTALEPHDDLELAWFTGSAADDLTERYAELVKRAARQLGARKIVFMGGSGGGFASLALAARTPGSRALVFNPQTNVRKYWLKSVRNYTKRLYPEFASEKQLTGLGARCDLAAAYAAAPQLEHQVLYVQNDDDPHHLENHLGPFAAALGMEPRSGVSADGTVRIVVERFAEGHNMPYRTVLNPFVDMVLAGWGGPLAGGPLPAVAPAGPAVSA
ncbi:DUF6270 domain-containing protein [Arthrobacter celericrescens]|uniref:DUF6270 domain-containing protein n=1 Tax=Arthrobacter celericrescens TaxID=2320851 RepID=UPI000EA02B7E|nr:DUF6270 domain-containing protein [Arthrobacter celericrescens]